MSKGIFIIGTDTDVGKTVVSAGLMYLLLKNKYSAAYFKPVASGEIILDGSARSADAAFINSVSGFSEEQDNITPFSFKNAVSPHLASRMENKAIDFSVIKDRLQYLKEHYELIIAEGAGGLVVPFNDNGFMQYDLIGKLGFPCLLVARTGLGTINHILLTLAFARSQGIKIKGIVMNGFENTLIEKDNIETIRKLFGVSPIITVPKLALVDTEKLNEGNIIEVFEKIISPDAIIEMMETI